MQRSSTDFSPPSPRTTLLCQRWILARHRSGRIMVSFSTRPTSVLRHFRAVNDGNPGRNGLMLTAGHGVTHARAAHCPGSYDGPPTEALHQCARMRTAGQLPESLNLWMTSAGILPRAGSSTLFDCAHARTALGS